MDLVVAGGGAIGLSIAWCAARRGARVTVLERGSIGRESSWAAAGILPYASIEAPSAYDRAMAESARLHPRFAERLLAETGVDVEYRRSGEILTALSEDERPALGEEIDRQRARGATVTPLDPASRSPFLAPLLDPQWLPETAQVHPPRFLEALEAACRARGVEIRTGSPVMALAADRDRIEGAVLPSGEIVASDRVVIAAGAWTPSLLEFLGPDIPPIRPLRGQIALLRPIVPPLESIVSVGSEYLVPRRDGRILVGATMEDVGYDRRTTARGIGHLLAFAARVVPSLADAEVERTWAGLRPATPSGEPVIGPAPGWRGLWIASGHTRQGIHLAPHTGEAVATALFGAASDGL